MFWSDFQSIQLVPLASVKTRGSMEPPWVSGQMKGVAVGTKGPVGEEPTASPMHCMVGLDPMIAAVKYST